jgi:hypothetical protein
MPRPAKRAGLQGERQVAAGRGGRGVAEGRRHGALVLGSVRSRRPKTLVLERAGAGQRTATGSSPRMTTAPRGSGRGAAARGTQPHRRDAGLDAGRGRVRRRSIADSSARRWRSRAVERAGEEARAASCSRPRRLRREKGSATLWVTRDRAACALVARRGLTAMQALERKMGEDVVRRPPPDAATCRAPRSETGLRNVPPAAQRRSRCGCTG